MVKINVSIIIPTFNSAVTLRETLNSILNQSYTNWECLIVDDGSKDETDVLTIEYSQKTSKIVSLKNDTVTKGVSASRNIGLRLAKGDFIIFLDSDDILHKDCLKNRLEFVSSYPDNDFWIFNMQEFLKTPGDLDYNHNTYPKVESTKDYLKLFLKGINAFSVTSPMWRARVVKSLNGFNESLHLLEDPELHIRALLAGHKLKANKNAEPDCFYRNNRKQKKILRKSPKFLKKLFKNSWVYYDLVALQIKDKEETYNRLLAYNIVRFMQTYCLDKLRVIPFFKFYSLLSKHRLISFRAGAMLLSWFLFRSLQIDSIGKYSQNSLRKRLYSLILKS